MVSQDARQAGVGKQLCFGYPKLAQRRNKRVIGRCEHRKRAGAAQCGGQVRGNHRFNQHREGRVELRHLHQVEHTRRHQHLVDDMDHTIAGSHVCGLHRDLVEHLVGDLDASGGVQGQRRCSTLKAVERRLGGLRTGSHQIGCDLLRRQHVVLQDLCQRRAIERRNHCGGTGEAERRGQCGEGCVGRRKHRQAGAAGAERRHQTGLVGRRHQGGKAAGSGFGSQGAGGRRRMLVTAAAGGDQ